VLVFMFSVSMIQAQDTELIISSIKKEVGRSKEGLKIDKLQPPFFISYALVESSHMEINASLGMLLQSINIRQRSGYPMLLVGSYERNNIGLLDFSSSGNPSAVTLESDPVGIATAIWRDMDNQYKNAAEKYETKISVIRQQNMKEEDLAIADYEKVTSVNIIQKPVEQNQDKSYWENYVKKASEALRKFPELTKSNVTVYVRNSMIYYYDTENSRYAVSVPYCRLVLNVEATTEDGHELNDKMQYDFSSSKQLPSLEVFTKECEAFATSFLKLLDAPMLDDSYSGPVLFEDQAVAEIVQSKFMNQQSIFAKAKPVVSDLMRQYYRGGEMFEGNNLEMMMNKKIISRSLSLKAITGMSVYEGIPLEGGYPVDFEGVVPEKEFYLVENGVLRSMLNGRIPTKKILGSNGHNRFNFNNMRPQIAPGNILLTSNDTYSKEDLKKKLLDAAKEEDLEYAYIVRRMWGNGVRMIYRIYVDDGREELVRGAVLDDFTIKSFKRILGAANKYYVRNTASFGSLATFIVPDGLLFEELEVRRNGSIELKTPFIVPRPFDN
jgi:Predicted Zn-dependent proteases and their inactivated homologs